MTMSETRTIPEHLLHATPLTLLVMAYEKAMSDLETAVACIDRNDIEGRWKAVESATDVVTELYLNLDHDHGGEIAHNLGCLYGFILSRLPRINFYNDRQTAMDSIAILSRLHSSWAELQRQGLDADMPTAAMIAAQSSESTAAAAI
jgi:flagellar secretion chaperone FliS